MRLAIVTESFPSRVNGVTRTVTALTTHLRSRGHQAIIFVPGGGHRTHDGFEVIGVPGVQGWIYPDLTISPVAPGMRRRLRRFDPDAVHLASPAALGVWGAWAARPLGVPVAAHYQTDLLAYARAYGGPSLAWMTGLAERLFYNRCTVTYAPTPPIAAELRRRGFEHVRISGRGVDTELFHPGRPRAVEARARWPEGEGARVLSVSRLAREKNLGAVVRIALQHPELRFLIVGTGPLAGELRGSAPSNLRLAGLLVGEPLADTYAAADIFLHPSATETFGQAVQEAMASGLPVVGIRAGGVGWLVEDGRTGVLVDPPGAGLGGALSRLAGGGEAAAMGAAARRDTACRSWSATFDTLLDEYAELSDAAFRAA